MADPIERLARAVLTRSPDVAHDLKTPLNILVLHIELLQMRLRKLAPEAAADEKVLEHCQSLERESRRVAAIMDAYLAIARMPVESGAEPVDASPLLIEPLREQSFEVPDLPPCRIGAYRSRLEKVGTLIAEGLASIIVCAEARVECSVEKGKLRIRAEGPLCDETAEVGKLFKFYYTNPSGEPNTALASARLLLETMGGTIEMVHEDGSVRFEIELQGDE